MNTKIIAVLAIGILLLLPAAVALDKSVDTIHARELWTAEWVDASGVVHTGVTGEGVAVAVVDSGVDGLHEDLDEDKLAYNAKYAGTWVESPNSDTTSGHGTHCAGIVGGTGERSDGKKKGVAPGCDLVGLGCGDTISVAYANNGLNWVKANAEKYNIRVVSCSWGSASLDGSELPTDTSPIYSQLANAGIVVIFAAGNDGGDGSSVKTGPQARNIYTLSVASCLKNGRLMSDFSSRGAKSNPDTWPDITAPGSDIDSCAATSGISPTSFPEAAPFVGDGYVSASGTSMACPHVSGVVALMFEVNPDLTPQDVMDIIALTADQNWGAYEESGYASGHGLINAMNCVAVSHYMLLNPGADVPAAVASYRIGTKDGHAILNPGVEYQVDNSAPLASFVFLPSSIVAGDGVSFTDTSIDTDGTVVAWNWDFGDGYTETVQNPKHTYSKAGTYTVKLTVTDNGGAKASSSRSLTVYAEGQNTPPSVIGDLGVSVYGGKVRLSWMAPADNGSPITGYNVYRSSEQNTQKQKIAQTSETSYVDDDVEGGNTYYYQVAAMNSVGEGGRSNEVSASIPAEGGGGIFDIPGFEVAAVICVFCIAVGLRRRH
ncbi:MAG: hypothetical protein CVT48_04320 [Thermoplasmata archaeon HGW-Thermoplasmata-1]|nr:MAG: hypothetical protein CVT48_04320 [Thermoplasmata archaeon HGW-Thermoplasmata-1]